MNNETVRRAFIAFHITLALIVFIQSIMTVIHSIHSQVEGHIGLILPWFAGLEALAAILFVIPKTLKIGGWILVAIFAVAIFVHGAVPELPLFVYLVGAIFVIVHESSFAGNTQIN